MTRIQRAGRVALALAVALPCLVVAAVAEPTPAEAADRLATISVATLDPIAARPGDTLRTAGTIRNVSRQVLRDVEVRLRLSQTPVGSRAELSAVASGQTNSRDGDVVAEQRPQPLDLPAGQQTNFELSLDLDEQAALDQFGVYVLGIEVLASHRDGFGRVAIQRTFLPWAPDEPGLQPTGFSWLWPVVAAPSRLANGTFADDKVATAMAPGGRLDRLVAAGAQLSQVSPLIWAVDPDLVETAADMSDGDGYQVRTPDGGSSPGGGTGLASLWLDQLRSATAATTVLALPYADVDMVALRRAGLSNDIISALAVGAEVTADLLDRPVRSDVVWPVDGLANRQTLSTVKNRGIEAAFLTAAAMPPAIELNYTPSGRAATSTTTGRMPTLLTDPVLTALLGSRSSAPLLAAQRFIAETAMITAELPGSGTDRVIVVAPPRHWAPDPELLNRVVAGSVDATWMAPVSLDQLMASDPTEVDRRPLRYPAAAREAELSLPYLTAIRSLHADTATLAEILSDPDAVIPSLDLGYLRLESAWWRGREIRVNRLAIERQNLTDLRAMVRVIPGSYTLGSSSGTIPLTIANELDQPVVVGVRLTPTTPRLEIEQLEPLTIAARSKDQVEVPVTAVAKGTVTVDATLQTPDGDTYASAVQLRIHVTQYGTVALYITIAAAGVLFLAAGVRLARRALSRRPTANQPPPSAAADADADAQEHSLADPPSAAGVVPDAGTARRE